MPLETAESDPREICRCIVTGFFSNAAVRQPDNTFRTVRDGHPLHLHPQSVLFKAPPQFVVFHEVLITNKEYMRDISTIDSMWLAELAPHYYSYKNKNIKVGGAARAQAGKGDPDAEMFEEGTAKRRRLGPVVERLT
eukprot:SAG22_NODE_2923_length_2101_cov_1.214286_3_plen_137_part_00